MQNNVILEKMDNFIEESRWIRKGNLLLEGFDFMGSLWPLHPGSHYLVDLDLQQLGFEDPVVINETKVQAEQIYETFAHYLYGYVEKNIFHVGNFKFDFSRYNDHGQYEKKFLKFKADRINVDFLEEIPTQNNS